MAIDIFLYNTESKNKERFLPITPGKVSMYHCGPTVYDYAHIGNLRAYVFSDILRRTFEANGYRVAQVINITDIGHLSSDADDGEDKMTKAIKREGKTLTMESMREIADVYANAYFADLEALNIHTEGTIFPRASAYVSEQIHLIERLDEAGFIYRTSDGLYFDTTLYPEYGRLGGIANAEATTEETQNRIATNTEKKNFRDFAVWKFNSELGWETIWGKGFPGWHLECSAMAMRLLGETIDIHTGGIDHISVHHNNEIAQSECATSHDFVHYWMHSAFLSVDQQKVAKSAGNSIYLKSIVEKGIEAMSYRYWLLGSHYRTPIDFSYEALQAAHTGYKNLIEKVSKLIQDNLGFEEGGYLSKEVKESLLKHVNDDLNTASLLAHVFEVVNNREMKSRSKLEIVEFADTILGLNLIERARTIVEQNKNDSNLPKEIVDLLNERLIARKEKNWAKSDEIRMKIESKGYLITDSPDGSQTAHKKR